MQTMLKSYYSIFLFIFSIVFVSCGGEEECPSYPTSYTYEFAEDDIMPIRVYSYDGIKISPTDDDPNQVYCDLFDGQKLSPLQNFNMEGVDFYTQKYTLISPSELDLKHSIGEMGGIQDSTIRIHYRLETEPNYYTFYSDDPVEYAFRNVQIAEDCSFIELCTWLILIPVDGDVIADAFENCISITEETFPQDYISSVNFSSTPIDQILLMNWNQRFEID